MIYLIVSLWLTFGGYSDSDFSYSNSQKRPRPELKVPSGPPVRVFCCGPNEPPPPPPPPER